MTTPNQLRQDWSKGIDNQSDHRRLAVGAQVAGQQQAGTVRDLVNLDPQIDGTLKGRAGFEQVLGCTDARAIMALGDEILVADGASLVCWNTLTASSRVLGEIDAAGSVTGAVFNDELFISAGTRCLRYDGQTLRQWGVPPVQRQPEPTLVPGGLAAGTYQIAATFSNAQGEEGATTLPLLITLDREQGLTFNLPTPPVGGRCNLYVSAVNGATLYLQAQGAGSVLVSRLDDSGVQLGTERLGEPLPGALVVAHNAVLLMAVANVLWFTLPLRPHLRDAARGFLAYPAPIDFVLPTPGGVYVGSDKTYFVTALETGNVEQREVLPYGGTAGVQLPDSRVAWMSQYGQVVGTPDGQVTLLSGQRFAPQLAATGAAGLIERHGNPMIVSTLRGPARENPLAASDYYEAEIIRHDT
ncbi:hypothetical protein [uncultured Pseudomonas sp.]|uniref:hypothetical protein n=1 Tax=uncultured Pseudomonas sp. TaxID=114707 RepID=UPI0025EE783A|nr:hypothetical protein [uncultured Pseudomonas sp.]